MPSPKRTLRMIADRSCRSSKKQPKYLSIRDLDKMQHYKTRNPPWIKLYWALLDDPKYLLLTETDRYRYIMCILIASRCENRILNDPTYLAKMMRLSDPVDLTALINSGLLLAWRKQPASTMQASRKQNALSESEERREREENREKSVGRKIVTMDEDPDSIKSGGSSEGPDNASSWHDGFEQVGGIQAEILKRQGLL